MPLMGCSTYLGSRIHRLDQPVLVALACLPESTGSSLTPSVVQGAETAYRWPFLARASEPREWDGNPFLLSALKLRLVNRLAAIRRDQGLEHLAVNLQSHHVAVEKDCEESFRWHVSKGCQRVLGIKR